MLYLSPYIIIIFNKSLQLGEVPDIWRQANVTPIYKKGSKSVALNYRPVSLTSVVCKIMERILKDRLTKEINEKSWFTNAQHGFRSKRSTTSNLLEFYDEVTTNIDNGNSVDIFFFDLAKAFDMVPHDRLLKKLRETTTDTYIIKWITEYLKERKQRVVIRGSKSNWLETYSGVPQGSVIGPLLFLIYVNDLPQEINSKLNMFADDTKMTSIVNSASQIGIIEKDLETLESWTTINFNYINREAFEVLYGVLVRPQLEYAIQLWSPYQAGLKENIERTQRRATKLVKGIRNRSYEERLKYLNLMTTQERRDRGDSIMTYNILSNNIDMGTFKLEDSNEHRTRGHTRKLAVIRSRTEIRRNFFTNRIVNRWNALGQRTVLSINSEAFKKAYDQEIPLKFGGST